MFLFGKLLTTGRHFVETRCKVCKNLLWYTAWKVSEYGVFSGMYFPIFSSNTGKLGLEKTPNLDNMWCMLAQNNFNIMLF